MCLIAGLYSAGHTQLTRGRTRQKGKARNIEQPTRDASTTMIPSTQEQKENSGINRVRLICTMGKEEECECSQLSMSKSSSSLQLLTGQLDFLVETFHLLNLPHFFHNIKYSIYNFKCYSVMGYTGQLF